MATQFELDPSYFTQHRVIQESNLHENKGVSSAEAGAVATANGVGVTEWKKLGVGNLDVDSAEAPGYLYVDDNGDLVLTSFDVSYDDEYTTLMSGLDYNVLRDGKRYFFMPALSAATNGPIGEERNTTWVTFDKVKDNEIYLQTVYSTITGKHYKRYYNAEGQWG